MRHLLITKTTGKAEYVQLGLCKHRAVSNKGEGILIYFNLLNIWFPILPNEASFTAFKWFSDENILLIVFLLLKDCWSDDQLPYLCLPHPQHKEMQEETS